jgi:outer membrane receptor protein involved in Fe transport
MPYKLNKIMLALLFGAASTLPLHTYAQTEVNKTAPNNVRQSAAVINFNIKSGSLDQALNQLAQQADINIAINGQLTAGKKSRGLLGSYNAKNALDSLLARTDIGYHFTDATTVTLVAKAKLATKTDEIFTLATLVVQGEKVERNLSKTASSVAVFNSETLKQRVNINSGNELLPSIVNVISTEGTNYAPSVRGIDGTGPARGGMAFFAGSRSRLAMLVDGRAAEFNELAFGDVSMWDVEQVEFYRGPQSTLNGRNAIAGAMIVTTKNPTFEQEGAFRIIGGNLNNRQFAGMYSAPLSQDWAFRVAAEKKSKDSYLDFEGYPVADNAGEYHSTSLRAKLLYQPSDEFSNLITVNYQDYLAPQGEGVSYPFEERQPQDINPAVFNPQSTSFSMNTSWQLDDNYTLENSIVYSDRGVLRHSPNVGRGNADIDGSSLLIEPRLKFNSDNQSVFGFVGLHVSSIEQDEFIDIFNNTYEDSTTNIALFGEANIALSDNIELVVGGRWEQERRERLGGDFAFTVDLDETYNAFSPKASINVELDPSWTIGALVSKGFNGGGAGVTFEPPFASYTYDEETVWNYEAFTRNELLDGKLIVNANVFFADYQNMQVPYHLGESSIIIQNIDATQTYGVEFGMRWLPTPELQIFTDIGLLNSEIIENDGIGLDSNELPRAPSATANVGFIYNHSSGFELGADARYSGSYYSNVDNTPSGEINSHTVANMQLAYNFSDYRVFAYVKNLTDVNEITFYRTTFADVKDNQVVMVQPRSWGIGLEFSF